MDKLRLEIIRTEENFSALKNSWNLLLSVSNNNHITSTWEWQSVWWQVYKQGKNLCIFTYYLDDKLVGIIPLFSRINSRKFHFFRFKTIELLASGEIPGEQIHSDYIGPIIKSGLESRVIQQSIQDLKSDKTLEWDKIILPDVSMNLPEVAYLKKYSSSCNLHFRIVHQQDTIIARLSNSFDDFLNNLGKNLRYQLRKGLKELQKLGAEFIEVKDEEELEHAFNILIDLHQKRWKSKGKPGAFHSVNFTRFHKELAKNLLKNNRLQFVLLKLNEKYLGAIYNFKYHNRIYFYQSGILTYSKNKHIRPGNLLHAYCIRKGIEENYKYYDFLKIGKNTYKHQWGKPLDTLVEIRIAKKNFYYRLYLMYNFCYEFLRSMKHTIERKFNID